MKAHRRCMQRGCRSNKARPVGAGRANKQEGEETMTIETKYDLPDWAYKIYKDTVKDFVVCKFCLGAGKVTGASGKSTSCPKCYGHCGRTEYKGADNETTK